MRTPLAVLLALLLASASPGQDVYLRGRRVETRDSLRQNEIWLEGLTEWEAARSLGLEPEGRAEVEREALRERTIEMYAGTKLAIPAWTPRPREERDIPDAAPMSRPGPPAGEEPSHWLLALSVLAAVGLVWALVRRHA